MNPPRRFAAARAFTLVELLTVITIIAVLAAIIFPALGAMMRKGYQTTSVSNLRQWYTAFSSSLTNHDGELPSAGDPLDKGNVDAWYNRLPIEINEKPFSKFDTATQPTYGKKSIWVNPIVSQKEWGAAGFVFNYGFNDSLVEKRDTTEGNHPLRMTTLQAPAVTILMGEKADAYPSLNVTSVKAYFNSNDATSDKEGKADLLFCDGHAEPVKRSVFADVKATDPTYLDTKQATVSWQPYGSALSKE